MDDSKFLILGANGQLGNALHVKYPGARTTDVAELDITNSETVANYDWSGISVILNAAAYTDVDGAETPEGSALAKKVNDEAVGYLAKAAKDHDLILVHISTDYVFDGTKSGAYTEDDEPNPQSNYAKSKATGDKKAATAPKHYLVRSSWVIGQGKNFVRTMLELGAKGVSPTVVSDQVGRLTFTTQLAEAIDHLLKTKAPYGTYNVTNDGQPASWADVTREIFKNAGYDLKVTDTTTAEYFASKPNAAPRPANSVLDLSKIKATGHKLADWHDDLKEYVAKEMNK